MMDREANRNIEAALRKAFHIFDVSVTCGDEFIFWTDGPTVAQVETFLVAAGYALPAGKLGVVLIGDGERVSCNRYDDDEGAADAEHLSLWGVSR